MGSFYHSKLRTVRRYEERRKGPSLVPELTPFALHEFMIQPLAYVPLALSQIYTIKTTGIRRGRNLSDRTKGLVGIQELRANAEADYCARRSHR